MAKKKPKKMQIEFAPGCFDNFEGTQEQLDSLVKEITDMFNTLTPEELKKRSRPFDIDDLIENDPEEAERVLRAFDKENKRKLQ